MAAVCIWTNMHQTVLFHTGQTVADKHWWGFLHTHLPMFWGQSSVEHHCCQRLLLHAHNNQITSPKPITGDVTAAFFGIKITQQMIYNELFSPRQLRLSLWVLLGQVGHHSTGFTHLLMQFSPPLGYSSIEYFAPDKLWTSWCYVISVAKIILSNFSHLLEVYKLSQHRLNRNIIACWRQHESALPCDTLN